MQMEDSNHSSSSGNHKFGGGAEGGESDLCVIQKVRIDEGGVSGMVIIGNES